VVVLSLAAEMSTADVHFVLQGVIWLVLGIAAELTPVVSLAWFLPRVFRAHDSFMSQLFICLFLNGNFLYPDLSLKCVLISPRCFWNLWILDALNIVCLYLIRSQDNAGFSYLFMK